MEKEFAPYNESLDLKNIGFDEPCFGWFRSTLIPSNFTEFFLETEFGLNEGPSDWVNSNFLDNACSAPLYQQAFRWFRDKHNLDKTIDSWTEQPTIDEIWGNAYQYYINGEAHHPYFKTYEEAELECLKKLIEIVKNKKETV